MLFECSLPQEDSDYERERNPPSPPHVRKLSRRGASFKLACIGKQDSDENPLMRKVGQPLRLTQSQVNQVLDHPACTCFMVILIVLSSPIVTVIFISYTICIVATLWCIEQPYLQWCHLFVKSEPF